MTKKVRKDGSEIDEDRRYIRWKSLEAVARFFIAPLLSYFWTRIPPLVLNFSFKIIFHPRQCQIKSILILSPSKGKGPADG